MSGLNPKREIFQILGCVLQNPKILNDKRYKLFKTDFPEVFHKIVFASIYNLNEQGIGDIDEIAIDNYISKYPEQYSIFQKNNGIEYLLTIKEKANNDNFQYNYDRLKKFSLLRRYEEKLGIKVDEIYDTKEVVPKKIQDMEDNFDNLTLEDIIKFFDCKILEIKGEFSTSNSSQRKKAGENGKVIKEQLKESPAMGLGLESKYLTTILRGARKKKYIVRSSPSGVGKSRTAIGELGCLCANEIWDLQKKRWVVNPNGKNNVGLYIGTEMDLDEEVDTALWSYVSGVPQENILDGYYKDGEEERVDRAIEILEESKIFLEHIPDFNKQTIREKIEEYQKLYGLDIVIFDYIEITSSLTEEYATKRRGVVIREDRVLEDLSKTLKDLAGEFDVWVLTMTQCNGDWKDEKNRDETLIAGSKGIVRKADGGIIAIPPTKKELELVDGITRNMGFTKVPNMVFDVYKNRGGKINKVKVWCYQDLDNMRIYDLFVTNKDYEPVEVKKTYINVKKDEEDIVF